MFTSMAVVLFTTEKVSVSTSLNSAKMLNVNVPQCGGMLPSDERVWIPATHS